MIPGAFPIIAGSRFRVKGIHFSGSPYLERGSNFSGLSDGTRGTVSFWLRMGSSTNGDILVIFYSSNGRFTIKRDNSNKIAMNGYASDDFGKLAVISSSSISADGQWHHVLASWNTSSVSNTKLYIDGSADGTTNVASGSIDYTDAPFRIGSLTPGWTGSDRFNGDLAEFWFSPVWIDLSVSANREKFRSTSGKPAYLGPDGSLPTGSDPIIYVTGPASSAATNHGSGGNFSVSGTLTDASTSPSD